MSEDPFVLFEEWYAAARKAVAKYPNAMSLATADEQGRPAVRMVLLKDYGPNGFVFYTNGESDKGRQLAVNPRAALCLYWMELGRQVRIAGPVAELPAAASDEYFASRDRMSRIGAWASRQSRPMKHRLELEQRVAKFAAKYPLGAVPRPEYWQGYAVLPERMEFWEERAFRLHSRRRFEKSDAGWRMEFLFP